MCKQPSHCPGNVPSWGGPENVVQKFPRYQLCALLSPFPVKYRFRQEKNLQWTLRDVWQLKLSRAGFCTAWFFFQLITTYQWTILISIYQISSFSSWIARNQLVILSELEAHSLCSLFSVVYSRKYETRMVGREIFLYPKQKKRVWWEGHPQREKHLSLAGPAGCWKESWETGEPCEGWVQVGMLNQALKHFIAALDCILRA